VAEQPALGQAPRANPPRFHIPNKGAVPSNSLKTIYNNNRLASRTILVYGASPLGLHFRRSVEKNSAALAVLGEVAVSGILSQVVLATGQLAAGHG